MKNLVKAKIAAGQRPLGTFYHTGSEITVELLAMAGMDYIILDTEHGPFDVESGLGIIRAAKYAGTTPFVRVKDSTRPSILKMLDAGAMGIIIPNVHSAAEARDIVKYGKYFPVGERGIAMSPGTGYWQQDWAKAGLDNYMSVSNSETMLLPQCETLGCLNEIEEIVAIDGIDGIFVGPFDLSGAMGKPGDFSNPDHIEALERVVRVCKEAGKAAFIFSGTVEDALKRYDQGYDSVTYSVDSLMLMEAARQAVAQLTPESQVTPPTV